tara:strand:- start:39 stop:518 length:480 start_codon:yes stop_codon:yes gene_type:complete
MNNQLFKLLLLIITATPLSAMAESVVLKDQVKKYIEEQPFDFEQMKNDAELINFNLAEKRRRFQVVDVDTFPTARELRISVIIHSLDVATTIYALENRDDVKEGNVILGPYPKVHEVILLKAFVLPFVHQNFEREQLVFMNWAGGVAVTNNFYVIHRYK